MELLRNRQVAEAGRRRRTALLAATCLMVVLGIAGNIRGADPVTANPLPSFQKYCFQCHGKAAMGGINLEQLTSQGSPGENFQQWDKVIAVLEQSKMPPKGMPQPTPDERAKALSWIRTELAGFIKKHEGDPGRVT